MSHRGTAIKYQIGFKYWNKDQGWQTHPMGGKAGFVNVCVAALWEIARVTAD